jgi:hypothetical protein
MKVNTNLCCTKSNHRENEEQCWHGDFSPEVHLVATKLRPRCVDQHFMVWRLIGITHRASQKAPQEPTIKCGSSNPPHKASPEPRIILLRASTEPWATKPSRRWQLPRVTNTTDLQHDHLVPLDAISQSNPLESTHSQSIRTLASTSELEALQALPKHGH